MQQLSDPPLLLGQTSLQHVEQTGGENVSACYCYCYYTFLLTSPSIPEGAALPAERTLHQHLKQPVQFSGVATFLLKTSRKELKDCLSISTATQAFGGSELLLRSHRFTNAFHEAWMLGC